MRKLFIRLGLTLILLLILLETSQKRVLAQDKASFWDIQSIDTVKFSRDLAREKLNDKSFENIIDTQIREISKTGATHVALGTPYDEEFLPFLKRWISASRRYNLNVWFRGNFSGWEGWFDYSPISQEEHFDKTKDFISKNPDLFENGDIFTPCTECENGGPGDPRDTKDISGHRSFLINEYDVVSETLKSSGKDVRVLFSMNADIAKLVMDKETTKALGGVVVIDHYVEDTEQLSRDIDEMAERSGGKIVLGEIGAPIPNIHGYMSEEEQAHWIESALTHLSKEPSLIGINYWVANAGSTALWNEDSGERIAVSVIKSFFTPKVVTGVIVNELGRSIKGAQVNADAKIVFTNQIGEFSLVAVPSLREISIKAKGYDDKVIGFGGEDFQDKIVLKKSKENLFFKIQKFIYQNFLTNRVYFP